MKRTTITPAHRAELKSEKVRQQQQKQESIDWATRETARKRKEV